jgi:orotate phosphoribosyltransferase
MNPFPVFILFNCSVFKLFSFSRLSQLNYSTSADFVLTQLRIKVFIMYTDSVKSELIKQIKEKAVVHGKVILSSGKEADYYVDLRRVTLDSVAAPLVGQAMLDVTKDLDFECVGGLTLGADPVATAMMHVAKQNGRNLNAFVVRKEGKAHGLQRRIEGPDVKGKKVLAVEDTSTTGGSVLTAVEALKEAGAIVVGVAVVVDRGAGKKIEEAGLKYLSVVSLQELGLS